MLVNRLRVRMALQANPTVIYGLGADFDGNLKRVHLRTDGPYNTYMRRGLPPSPIALPGHASLRAAMQPARIDAFYYVSRGDGSSQFSRTLREHNRAVTKYQLKPGPSVISLLIRALNARAESLSRLLSSSRGTPRRSG